MVHLHNLFPLISARVVGLAQSHGAKVVQTVHNFRHVCIAGTYFRDGHECFDCRGHAFGRPGVKHACYRGSTAESLVMATAIAAYRRQLRRPDAVIALAPHLRDHCVDYGFPAERIEVIPNTTTDPGEPTPARVRTAVRGAVQRGEGTGAARRRLVSAAGARRPAGSRSSATGRSVRSRSRSPHRGPTSTTSAGSSRARSRTCCDATAAVVVPSRWQEVCPTIVVDALAHGRPVLATDRGGLPYLLGSDAGWLVSPSPGALADGIRRAVAGAPAKAAGARQRFLDAMAPDVVLTRTTDLYERIRSP